MSKRVTELEQVLIERDKMLLEEAREMIDEARKEIASGRDPEEILYEDFGLEPDYIFDLLEGF